MKRLIALSAMGLMCATAHAQSFMPVPDTEAGNAPAAGDFTPDGQTMVGTTRPGVFLPNSNPASVSTPFFYNLGAASSTTLPSGGFGNPSVSGVSDDGRYVIGNGSVTGAPSFGASRALVWDTVAGGAPQAIASPVAGRNLFASDITGDGSTLVGREVRSTTAPNFGGSTADAVLIDRVTGAVQTILTPGTGERFVSANKVSTDGSTVLGSADALVGATGPMPSSFYWTQNTGRVALPSVGGFNTTIASDLSDDGGLIVGVGRDTGVGPNADLPFAAYVFNRITSDLQILEDFAGGLDQANATSITGDGAWIGGSGNTDDGVTLPFGLGGQRAALWKLGTGGDYDLIDTQSLLEDTYGLDLAGWTLVSSSISDDGSVIYGTGVVDGNLRTYVAVVPEPATIGLLTLAGCGAAVRRRRA